MSYLLEVREHIPLEQGLRRSRLKSLVFRVHRQRAYSIRTRIKTASTYSVDFLFLLVREHIPLEQGLRPR